MARAPPATLRNHTKEKQLRAALRWGGAQSREGGEDHVARAPPATLRNHTKKAVASCFEAGQCPKCAE